jgi:hypothetical protein
MLQEAIVKRQKGVGMSDKDLELLHEHYSILLKHLDLEGDRMLLQYRYCYENLTDINQMMFSRKLLNTVWD